MTRAVLFDLGGVVVKNTWDVLDAHWTLRLGLDPGAFLAAVFGGNDAEALVGKVAARDWWTVVYERLGLDDEQREELRAEIEAASPIDDQMVSFIRSLRPPHRTAYLSNAWDDVRPWLGRQGIADAVDEVIISAEVGVAKPDPRIYRVALERLGAQPADAIFIDDSEVNVEAARVIGITAILARSTRQVIDDVTAVLAEI
jgi:putative hydrolase of the HAD superfamily